MGIKSEKERINILQEMRFVSDNMKLLDVIASEVSGVQGVRDFRDFSVEDDGWIC